MQRHTCALYSLPEVPPAVDLGAAGDGLHGRERVIEAVPAARAAAALGSALGSGLRMLMDERDDGRKDATHVSFQGGGGAVFAYHRGIIGAEAEIID